MAQALRKSRLGNPLFEHVLMLIVAGLVIGAVSYYAQLVLEQTEHAVVDATLMNIRSGMRLEQAKRIVAAQAPLQAGGNPIRFLLIPPAGYVAEAGLPKQPAPGTWYYHAADDTLYYVPQRNNHLHFLSVTNGTVLGWKVVLSADSAKAATLQTVIPYRWF
jgi:hypothetical protein